MKLYRNVTQIADVKPLDTSYIKRAVMAENSFQMDFYSKVVVNIKRGDYCTAFGSQYFVSEAPIPELVKGVYKYSVKMTSTREELEKCILRQFGSSEVVYTCTPLEFLQLVVSCMQVFQPTKGWTVGACITGPVLTVSFTGQTCLQAMQAVCGEDYWNTEFYTDGFTLNFKKQEITPVPIKSFSIGNGLKSITQEKNTSKNYYTRLYAFGSTKNLPSTYPGKRLKMDVAYLEDATASVIIEKEQYFEDIFPRCTGTVSEVSTINGVYYFKDSALPYNPNDLQIDGLAKHVVFKTGDLIGLDFEVNYNPTTGFFELIPYTDKAGFSWPSVAEKPAVGNTYVLYNIEAPQAHIDAAMIELKAAAQAALNEHKTEPVALNITTDNGLFFQNATELELGEVIKVSHTEIPALIGGRNIRITEFKRYLNTIYKYDSLKVSDVVYSNPVTEIKEKIDKTEKILDKAGISNPTYASRNWSDMAELANMINTLRASMLLIGEVQGSFSIPGVSFVPNYQNNKNMFFASAGQLKHKTMPTEDNPGTWSITSYADIVTGDATPYYVYAKCSRTNSTASFYLSATEKAYDSDPNYYYFFIGGLSSVLSGSRVFATTYGYTQITGNTIRTGVIISVNGTTKFDLDNNSIQLGEKFKYNVNGDGQLVIDGSIMQHTSVKDDGGNVSVITLDRGPFTLAKHPFYPGNITTFEGAAYLCHTLTVPGIVPSNTNYFRPYSEKGENGKTAIFGYITNENCPLSASNLGVVSDYLKANGDFKIFKGEEDVTPFATFKAVAKDCSATIKESQQLIHDWADGVVQGNFDTSANWQELSGLTAAYKAGNENYLWVLSDSPANMIAAISKQDASNKGVWSLVGTPSKIDWEDVESSVVDGVPYLYVFDFGNNPNTVNSRGAGVDMVIHRLLEPTITGADGSTADYMSIQCAFPAGNMPTLRDCEAAIIDPVTGDIFIITKRESVPGVYKLAHQNSYTGIQTLIFMGKMWDIPDVTTLALSTTACNVVDATINKDGTEVVVKNYNEMYLFLRNPATQTIYQALTGVPTIIQGYVGGGSASPAKSHPSAEPQGEGICFDASGINLYSHSEYATGSSAGNFPLFKYSRAVGTPGTIILQDGANPSSAYAGTRDTYIWDTNPAISYGLEASFVVDNVDATETGRRKGLLKFDTSTLNIQTNAIIIGARLDLNIAVEGQGFSMYKMLVPWAEDSTFASLGGVSNDGIKATVLPDCINGRNLDGVTGQLRNNVPISTIQEWVRDPSSNYGWMFDAADALTGDGVQFSSREDATVTNRPKLTIRYILPDDVAGHYKLTAMPSSNNDAEVQLTGTYEGISIQKTFSVSKSKVGETGLTGAAGADGSAGVNARYVALTSSAPAIIFNTAGALVSPTTGTLNAIPYNFIGTPYYEFFNNDVSLGASAIASSKVVSLVGLTYSMMPLKIEVQVREGSATGAIVARDMISIVGLMPGSSGISVVMPNQSHTAPADNAGNVLVYTGSGTSIEVYEGSTKLQFNTVLAPSKFTVLAAASNITAGARTGSGTNTCIVADHSAFLVGSDKAAITYTITVQRADGTNITVTAIQTITKSKAGATGLTGAASPICPNRGVWVVNGTYVGNSTRQDLVRYSVDGVWYKASPTAGTFTDAVWTPAHWVSFGYSGESVATLLLLAQYANIANFIFDRGKMISQAGTVNSVASTDYTNALFVPYLTLDGTTGEIIASNITALGKFRTAASGKRVEIDNKTNAITIFDATEKAQVVISPKSVRSVTDLLGGVETTATYTAHTRTIDQSSTPWTGELGASESITISPLKIYNISTPVVSYNLNVTPSVNAAWAEVYIYLYDITNDIRYTVANKRVSSAQPGANASESGAVLVKTFNGLPGSVYRLMVDMSIGGDGMLQAYASVGAGQVLKGIVVDTYSEMGLNGFNFMTGASNWIHFAEDGLKSKGDVDIAGGLGGCYVPYNTGGVNRWGKLTSATRSGSVVTINHSIGDDKYTLMVIPIGNYTWYTQTKLANSIQVVCSGYFDCVLIRTPY